MRIVFRRAKLTLVGRSAAMEFRCLSPLQLWRLRPAWRAQCTITCVGF